MLLVQSALNYFILCRVSLQHVCTLCNLALQNRFIQLAQLVSFLSLPFPGPVSLPSSSINTFVLLKSFDTAKIFHDRQTVCIEQASTSVSEESQFCNNDCSFTPELLRPDCWVNEMQ